MNRQDAKSAKETRYGASEISFKSSQTRSIFYLTWRSWRLGGAPPEMPKNMENRTLLSLFRHPSARPPPSRSPGCWGCESASVNATGLHASASIQPPVMVTDALKNEQLAETPTAVRFSPKTFAGDEDALAMSDDTRKRLRTKGDDVILNTVAQNLGIAYDWHRLTDALARSLAANWRRARTMSEGRVDRGGAGPQDATQPTLAGPDGRALPAFRGEIEAAGSTADMSQLQFAWAV